MCTDSIRRVQLEVSHLILACRSPSKGEAAKNAILQSCPSSSKRSPEIEVWTLDMASYASVLDFGERTKSLERLDAVILNAGVFLDQFVLAEKVESTLTVNVLSTLLLAHLVLPKLQETAGTYGRSTNLTFVGSAVHMFAKEQQLLELDQGKVFETLSVTEKADMADRYNLSKLILTLGVRDLVARLEKSEAKKGTGRAVINNVNPGWCKTELFRDNDVGAGVRLALRLIGRTGEQGARTLVNAAAAGKETHGRYLSECRVKNESRFVRSEEGRRVQERLGRELVDRLEKIQAGVTVH